MAEDKKRISCRDVKIMSLKSFPVSSYKPNTNQPMKSSPCQALGLCRRAIKRAVGKERGKTVTILVTLVCSFPNPLPENRFSMSNFQNVKCRNQVRCRCRRVSNVRHVCLTLRAQV